MKVGLTLAAAAGGLYWLERRAGDEPAAPFGSVQGLAGALVGAIGRLAGGAGELLEGSVYTRGVFDVVLDCQDGITPGLPRAVFNVATGKCRGTIENDVGAGELGKEGTDRWVSTECCTGARERWQRWKHSLGAGFLE